MIYKVATMMAMFGAAAAEHWAVIVAGSAGYGNYRHQADACHAYQVVTAGGIKPENVILLAVDDIANYRTNPFPGQVFNKPTDAGTPGVDVYDGCVIDYKGTDVTPETFTKVLTGDDSAGGKVLKSGADDRVFVNFVDHGAVGLIGFPTSQMHATELLAALQKMHDASMYKELVFYLEACESGSMFANLPANMNIYATTAANGKESSWGTYCMPDDKVDGKEIHSCLGDLYSVNWMEDTDKGMASEVSRVPPIPPPSPPPALTPSPSPPQTLEAQFNTVKTETAKSHVMMYGDATIDAEVVSNFQGTTDSAAATKGAARQLFEAPKPKHASTDLKSADAEIASAFSRFMHLDFDDEAAEELLAGIKDRREAKTRFAKVVKSVQGAKELKGLDGVKVDVDCHYQAHKAYVKSCGEWTTGALKHSATLAELCHTTGGDAKPIMAALAEAC